MELTVRGLNFASTDRSANVTLVVTLLREIPGSERPDYWLGSLEEPLTWISDSEGSFEISHVVLASQWENTRIHDGVMRLPVGIAYVTDPTLLDEDQLDLAKVRYVATGVADDTTPGRIVAPKPSLMDRVVERLLGKRAAE